MRRPAESQFGYSCEWHTPSDKLTGSHGGGFFGGSATQETIAPVIASVALVSLTGTGRGYNRLHHLTPITTVRTYIVSD